MDYLALIDADTLGIKGMRCRDITPIFHDPAALTALADDLLAGLDAPFDKVVGLEALGFILATAVALRAGKGIIPVRKGHKLPVATQSGAYSDKNGQGVRLELRQDAITPGLRVLLVDDWIRTGTQVSVVANLVEAQGGVVAGMAALNIDENDATWPLLEAYRVSTVLRNGRKVLVACG